MTIIEGLYQYLKSCPLLQGGRLGIDYLTDAPQSYSINPLSCDPVLQSYVDGSTVRQYVFSLESREYYGPDAAQQMENSGFYEAFSQWLDDQSRLGVLPVLPEGMQAQKVEPQFAGYLKEGDPSSARYQIQCRLVYLQEVK